MPFWFGESDEATPAHIREAAVRSLGDGETFYAHNLGLAELREALAHYVSALHRPVDAERIAVTSSGVNALMLAMQALVGAGDEVVAVVPVWPNLTAQPAILGARVVRAAARGRERGAWQLDLDSLRRCRDLGHPGAARQLAEQPDRLDAHPRRAAGDPRRTAGSTGTWIVADEVYERVFFAGAAGACAPSFLDIAEPDDRLARRAQLLEELPDDRLAPRLDGRAAGRWPRTLGKLIEFNTSCAPVFVQRAGAGRAGQADAIVPELVERLRACRDTLAAAPRRAARASRWPSPPAACTPSSASRARPTRSPWPSAWWPRPALGLAPGAAFGPEGEGWLRWCFASRDPARLVQGVERLQRFLGL